MDVAMAAIGRSQQELIRAASCVHQSGARRTNTWLKLDRASRARHHRSSPKSWRISCRTSERCSLTATGTRLGSVKLKVADLERARDFYVSQFGMTLVQKLNEWEWVLRAQPDDDVQIMLCCFEARTATTPIPDFGPGMLVLWLDDAAAAAADLRAYGIADVVGPVHLEGPGIVITMAHDPDGNVLELVSRV
jgi:catechol 2,3-dioxygenase-like lactoylglutathione lyase family enzyme